MQNFSFPKTENRQFKFSPKIPYDLVAERSEATSKTLPNSHWLAWQDSFRTYDWTKALPVPELVINQINQLLSVV